MNRLVPFLWSIWCSRACYAQTADLQHTFSTFNASAQVNKRQMGPYERKTFSDEEITRPFEFILSPMEARKEATELNTVPDYKGFAGAVSAELNRIPVRGPRSYDGDFLDLMSLVSASCAERAWALLGVTASEGVKRRGAFLKRIGPILRRTPDITGI